MNQGSGLKGVVCPLMTHVATRQSSQLVVNDRYVLGSCRLIALGQLCQQDRYVCGCPLHIGRFFRQECPRQLAGNSTSIQAKEIAQVSEVSAP